MIPVTPSTRTRAQTSNRSPYSPNRAGCIQHIIFRKTEFFCTLISQHQKQPYKKKNPVDPPPSPDCSVFFHADMLAHGLWYKTKRPAWHGQWNPTGWWSLWVMGPDSAGHRIASTAALIHATYSPTATDWSGGEQRKHKHQHLEWFIRGLTKPARVLYLQDEPWAISPWPELKWKINQSAQKRGAK